MGKIVGKRKITVCVIVTQIIAFEIFKVGKEDLGVSRGFPVLSPGGGPPALGNLVLQPHFLLLSAW
jgi:hypothetical protein